MPKLPLLHANERVDKVDLAAVVGFPRDLDNLLTKYRFLDRQDRILRGFRIEIPDQAQFPGRVVVHGGFGHQYDGQHVFNEDQLNVSRTVTLEGSNTTFYLEVEFVESESDVDARAFWDATVDQGFDISGDALPDGQEFSANVATRKTPDWQVVTPISTSGFARDQVASLNSVRIPLAKLRTDSANEITGTANTNLVTGKAASTMLRFISTTQIVVQDPWLFQAGDTINVTDVSGVSASSVTTVNLETGLLTIAAITTKAPGAIVQVTSASSPDFIQPSIIGRYRRIEVDTGAPNHVVEWRDMLWQGDEIHGDILQRGHASVTDRNDLNLQSLKDHIDFLAAQIQEMKWGVSDPYETGIADSRIPVGLITNLPATPRYYDRAGGILPARIAAVTVGDGASSFGDFNGADESVLQKAHDSLPASGGRIFLKRGDYSLTADLDWTNTGEVVLEGEEGSRILLDGGSIHIATTGVVVLRNLTIEEGTSTPSNIGILVDTSNPAGFKMDDVKMLNAAFQVNALLPSVASFRRVRFTGNSANMSTYTLVKVTGAAGTLSGTFVECDFAHWTYSPFTMSLIDALTASPTLSCSQLNFVDCGFSTVQLNAEGVHLGNTISVVRFDRCNFASLLTLCHIRSTGGAHLKVTNCVSYDALAGFVQAVGVNHVTVDGYLNPNSVGFAAVECIDCEDVKIINCDVKVNSGFSLVGTAFKIVANPNTIRNVDISNNTIRGDAGANHHTTGIIFDQSGGVATVFDGIRIANNTFDTVEVGVYFANSGAVSTYRDLSVIGNSFYDFSAGVTQAIAFKIGILFGSASDRSAVVISDNVFHNLKPADSDTISAQSSRCGILIQGSNNNHFTVTGNVIRDVGDSTYALPETCGIFINALQNSVIANNVIEDIRGAGAFGIRIGSSSNDVMIIGNDIDNIATYDVGGPTGIQADAWGIYGHSLNGVGIVGNRIGSLTSTVVFSKGVAIGNDASGATWYNVTITGNTLTPTDTDQVGIYSGAANFRRSVITGNTCIGTCKAFVEWYAGAGGVYDGISISGNDVQGPRTYSVRIDVRSCALARNFSISGNVFNSTLSGSGIEILGLITFSVTGNMVHCDGDAEAIYFYECLKFTCSGNTTSKSSGVLSSSIKASTSCNYYNISGNVVDQNGGAGTSIDTISAAQTGNGMVTTNVVDANTNVGTDNVTGGNLAF